MTGNFISNTKLLALITASAIVIGSIFLLQDGIQTQTFSDSPTRAVIIDQLYDDYPNDWFHQNATDFLMQQVMK